MFKKGTELLVALSGAVLLLASLLADKLGIGSDSGEFGWRQTTGTVIGAVLLLVGLWMARRGGD